MPSYLEAYRAARANANFTPDASPGPASPLPDGRKASTNPIPATPQPPPAAVADPSDSPGAKQSTPRTPSKPSKNTPQQARTSPTKKAAGNDGTKEKLDIAKQKGLYDTKPLRTKVAKWQALDESVVPGLAAERQEATSGGGEGKLAASDGLKPSSCNAAGGKANKSSTAPKQRLVSDEHWKKNRSSPKDLPEQPLETKLQNLIIERGLYVPPGAKTPEGWVRKRQLPPVKKPTESPRKDEAPTPASKNVKKRINDWQGNVQKDDTPPEAIPIDEDEPEGKPAARPNPQEKPSASGDEKQKPVTSPIKRPPNIVVTKDGQLGRVRRKSGPKPASPPTEPSEEQASAGLSHPMINRMQNWLMQTEDPFVESPNDHDEVDDDPHIEPQHRRGLGPTMAPRQTAVRDRHQRHHQKPRARRRSSEEMIDSPTQTDDDTRSQSSLGLRRSGARRRQQSPGAKPRSASATPAGSELEVKHRNDVHETERTLAIHLAPVGGLESQNHEAAQEVQLHSGQQRPGLRRKLTDHDDLISVLSMSNNDQRPLKPSKSSRTGHEPSLHRSAQDALEEFRSAEKDYLEDLKTLLDGVVPVLLNHAMSRTGGSRTQLSDQTSKTLANARDAIIELGIILERLLSAHRRAPLNTVSELQSWASRNHQIYSDYINIWRLGFENVVVNLAPANSPAHAPTLSEASSAQAQNSQLRKANVPSLLKRPLVRVKQITRTLKTIHQVTSSDEAAAVASDYEGLVEAARLKQDEERARLEDEAAAALDTSRTRDPITLAPLPGVRIRADLGVRARDVFDLHLHHSSGQRIDCRVTLFLRDGHVKKDKQGDVLFCQMDNADRWLLLPPANLRQLSARHGDSGKDLVVMLRPDTSLQVSHYELLTLSSSSSQTVRDWIDMLGCEPCPPMKIFKQKSESSHTIAGPASSHGGPAPSEAGTDIAHSEIDVPLGEQSVLGEEAPVRNPRIEAWIRSAGDSNKPGLRDRSVSFAPVEEDLRTVPSDHASSLESATAFDRRPGDETTRGRFHSDSYTARAKNNLKHFFSDFQATIAPPTKIIERRRVPRQYDPPRPRSLPRYPSTILDEDEISDEEYDTVTLGGARPLPALPPKVEAPSPGDVVSPQPPSRHPLSTIMSETGGPASLPIDEQKASQDDAVPSHSLLRRPLSTIMSEASGPRTPQKGVQEPSPPPPTQPTVESTAPKTPSRYHGRSHQSPSLAASPQPVTHNPPKTPPNHLGQVPTPRLSPSTPKPDGRRRSSSPLKHEYAPSSPSVASSVKGDLLSDDEDSVTSDSSVDDGFVLPVVQGDIAKQFPTRSSRPSSAYSPQDAYTLTPSQSASQAPFRTVPQQPTPQDVQRTIASIFSWSDRGYWELLHPDECSIIVSPGLIEAFTLSAAHSKPTGSNANEQAPLRPEGERPLIALELTPLVPLRQGTAIDISIRSPPTPASLIRRSNNIMFRSRSGPECDALYALINRARINNPTYIALQNARPSFGTGPGWANIMERQASQRGSRGFFGLGSKKSSYRASTRRGKTASIAETRSSVASMSSAISALKRFSTGSKVFNVARSTVTSSHDRWSGDKSASRGSTWTSSSGDTGGSRSGYGTPPHSFDVTKGTPAGVTDRKIRLYERENASKWRDMGRARLTILHPPPKPGVGTAAMISPTGHLRQEKRVLVTGKTRGETLLDVTLGETAFERVARTGIAVMVGEELETVGETGGVGGARRGVYMLQMKSEAEAAYTFSLVGRLRY